MTFPFTSGLLVALGVCLAPISRADSSRERSDFNADWRFTKEDAPGVSDALSYAKIKPWMTATGNDLLNPLAQKGIRPAGEPVESVPYCAELFDDSSWRQISIPHDWGIEGPFKQEYPGDTGKLPWWGIGWYRKHFRLDAADSSKRIFLDFDGAMAYANVWVNGHYVGGWPYGYSSFELDVTSFVKAGEENIVAVRLENPKESSRWYPGGGIYRNVWLVKSAPIHVAHWGTFIKTPVISADAAAVVVDTVVQNDTAAATSLKVGTRLFEIDANGNKTGPEVTIAEPTALTRPLLPNRQAIVTQTLSISKPRLWTLDDPRRYVAVTTVETNGEVVDSYETVFGIRSFVFTPDKGFILNGKSVRINGVCDHHDLGALGAAVNIHAVERQLRILKEMGCNAIRTSHNPPAPELLDCCDRLGLIVMDETFDCWVTGKHKNDYGMLFTDWHEKDTRALVRRDRNHPSVVLWSIGNEVPDQGSPEGWRIASHLSSIVHEEDPTRPTTSAYNQTASGYNGMQTAVDVMGYNYKPTEYAKFRLSAPTLPLVATETSSAISSRGEYFFPVSNDKAQGRANFQMSSYDLYAPRWAMPPDDEFRGQEQNPFCAGEFVWTGFDYLGEPTPYNADTTNLLNFSDPVDQERMAKELKELGKIKVPSRSSYFGIVDLCGFKKDRFFIYQAHWRPELPMVHILPHWNWAERIGQVTPVHVYTSGDEAELFLNGLSLGRKKKAQYEYRLRWDDVVYAPGELRVVAYKNGAKWAEETVKTTGAPASLHMAADRSVLKADGEDLSFITVSVSDAAGVTVPRSNNRVHFAVEGPAEIVATDNGDATSFESFQSKERNAYNGLALVIVRTKRGVAGKITLNATADGLPPSQLSFSSTD